MKITEITAAQHPTVYVDMDGVVADFAKAVQQLVPGWHEGGPKELDRQMWKEIARYQKQGGHFWYELDLMPDAMVLWNYVKKYNPQMLTAAGTPEYNAGEQKHRWIAEKFGNNVKVNVVRRAAEKAQFANANAVLIDDKRKALDPWEAAGGIGVLHISAANTIAQLKQLGL